MSSTPEVVTAIWRAAAIQMFGVTFLVIALGSLISQVKRIADHFETTKQEAKD